MFLQFSKFHSLGILFKNGCLVFKCLVHKLNLIIDSDIVDYFINDNDKLALFCLVYILNFSLLLHINIYQNSILYYNNHFKKTAYLS